jgi:predicted secreted protein
MKRRQKRWQLITSAVSGFLALSLLALAEAEEHSAMQQPKYVTVTVKEKDKGVSLAVGDTLVVRLEAPQSEKGLLWHISKNDKDLLKPLDKIPEDKVGKSRPGLVDLQVFYLKAEARGKVELQFEYKQPKDKDRKPADTYKVTVQID